MIETREHKIFLERRKIVPTILTEVHSRRFSPGPWVLGAVEWLLSEQNFMESYMEY